MAGWFRSAIGNDMFAAAYQVTTQSKSFGYVALAITVLTLLWAVNHSRGNGDFKM